MAITNMIVKDYLPLSIVQGERFLNLMNTVIPDYQVPSRNTIRSRIDNLHDEQKNNLNRELKKLIHGLLRRTTFIEQSNKVSDVSTVLKDFNVTTYMSTEQHISTSQLYPIVCGLLEKSLNSSDTDNSVVRQVKSTLANEIKQRFKPTDDNIGNQTPIVASILDPRYKRLTFLDKNQS
ncbi:unnamed protein product [Mytilus edulis]|uniref:Uncharacterized protein n=1 Tax=Mytilus edulis TaxID=6550 RepID=A0A8S3VM78_MYTED|nr:unnamed protein product [Mytilus edulis]